MGGKGFEDRFPALWDLAYRVAFRLSGSREQAEDVAQVTLERAFKQWRKVGRYCEPWVVRVATNLVLDAHRAQAVASRASTDQAAVGSAADAYLGERMELRQALAALPERQRSVVVLRHLYDYSVNETAAALDISVGSVKTHAHRGLQALRNSLPSGTRMLIGQEDVL